MGSRCCVVVAIELMKQEEKPVDPRVARSKGIPAIIVISRGWVSRLYAQGFGMYDPK